MTKAPRLTKLVVPQANTLPIDEAPLVDLSKGLRARYGLCPIANVLANPASARTHNRRQIGKLARGLDAVGHLTPAIIDEQMMLLAGHARLQASKMNGAETMPVVQVFGLSEARKRAFLIADNRIAADAGWDRNKLAQQLPELEVLFEDTNLTLEDTGFEIAGLDEIRVDFDNEAEPDDEISKDILGCPPVLRAGDLIALTNHRLLVGDCRTAEAVDRLCDGRKAAAAFLDPPYNVAIRDIVGRGRSKHGEFAMASGEMSPDEFVAFLKVTLGQATRVSTDGGVHFVCMDHKHLGELLEAGAEVYGRRLDLVVWNKTNAGQGSFYRQQHELIGVFRVGEAPHRNNIQLGRFGRNRSNVWTYPGANTFRAGRMADLAAHPTVKPLRLVADALRDVTRPGDAVLDLFCGSGTTLLAAEKVGRHALVMEIDPKYADVAVRRWQAATGRDAVDAVTGVTFDELAAGRREEIGEGVGDEPFSPAARPASP